MQDLNIAEMAQGAFNERFQEELLKVLANIADPNTDPKKARTVTMKMTLKGDENRDVVTCDVMCSSKTEPAKPVGTRLIIGREKDGKVVGAELMSGQRGQTFLDTDGKIKTDKGEEIKDGKVINFNK